MARRRLREYRRKCPADAGREMATQFGKTSGLRRAARSHRPRPRIRQVRTAAAFMKRTASRGPFSAKSPRWRCSGECSCRSEARLGGRRRGRQLARTSSHPAAITRTAAPDTSVNRDGRACGRIHIMSNNPRRGSTTALSRLSNASTTGPLTPPARPSVARPRRKSRTAVLERRRAPPSSRLPRDDHATGRKCEP